MPINEADIIWDKPKEEDVIWDETPTLPVIADTKGIELFIENSAKINQQYKNALKYSEFLDIPLSVAWHMEETITKQLGNLKVPDIEIPEVNLPFPHVVGPEDDIGQIANDLGLPVGEPDVLGKALTIPFIPVHELLNSPGAVSEVELMSMPEELEIKGSSILDFVEMGAYQLADKVFPGGYTAEDAGEALDLDPEFAGQIARVAVDLGVGFLYAGAVLKTIGGLTGGLINSTWWRRLHIKDRRLVIQTIEGMQEAGLSEAEILKSLSKQGKTVEFNKFKAEAIQKRRMTKPEVTEVPKAAEARPKEPEMPEVKPKESVEEWLKSLSEIEPKSIYDARNVFLHRVRQKANLNDEQMQDLFLRSEYVDVAMPKIDTAFKAGATNKDIVIEADKFALKVNEYLGISKPIGITTTQKPIYPPEQPKPAEIKKPEITKGKIDESIYEQNRQIGKPKISKEATRVIKETKKDIGHTIDEYLGVLSTRIANIHPGAKTKLRKFEYSIRKTEKADIKAVEPMLQRSTKEMIPEDLADFDLARKNADTEKIKGLVEKYNLKKEYGATRKVLDDIHERAKEVGFDVKYLKEYHPRAIKDPQGLLEYFQKGKDWPIIKKAIEAKSKDLGRYLTVEEKAQVANSILRGEYRDKAGPGAFKGRKIKVIDSELNKFYDTSDSSLVNYIRRVNEQIEVRRFFGKGITSKDFVNIEDSIGSYVIELIAEEKIRPDQEAQLTKLFQARFQAQGPGRLIGLYRDLSYVDTMGSVVSAITQIGDMAWAVYKSGIAGATKGAWASIKGKPLLTKEDIGITQIAQEFTNPTKASRAVATVFRLTGLEQIDKVGKEALMHSTIKKYQKMARDSKKVKELRKELEPIFEGETDQLIKDLGSGELTENIEFLGFYTLLDFQPVALSEMTEKYLTSKDGRIFYMLKTFTLKQFDAFRREAFQKIKSDDPKEVRQGMKNLFRLGLAFIVLNASADAIKNLILDRPMDLEDMVVDNILRTFGVSKFLTWKAREEGVGSAVGRQILPPFKFLDSIYKDITMGTKKGSETIQSLPLVGKLYYWWFGKGKEKSKKRARRKK